MKFPFIAAEKAFFPVTVLCNVLDVSRSGYYAWTRRGEPKRKASDAQLAVEIVLGLECPIALRLHQDIPWLDVAVNEAKPMGFVNRRRYFAHDFHALFERQSRGHHRERLALDVLHGNERFAVRFSSFRHATNMFVLDFRLRTRLSVLLGVWTSRAWRVEPRYHPS